MFYQMIRQARDRWYASDSCTAAPLIRYMLQRGQLRDAQIDAIRTYLFLKIACGCRPLGELFCQGAFNTLSLEEAELTGSARAYLSAHPAAAALFEYARLRNDQGEQVSAALERAIRQDPAAIDCQAFFQRAFYHVSYPDYLFSLPMGAGKTYLMAAFIYLDLYFAGMEPDNPAFAHNFILFAPSGLKSSVVPSLRTIQNFDPAWVLPEPAAGNLRRQVIFEVLDQSRSARGSNQTRNPNVQKIANHQPFSQLFGLVAVTNAEKVILDRIREKDGQVSFFDESTDEKDRQANELRNLIGALPSLAVFIDEVHHAVRDEIKLRAVVNRWAANRSVNSVVGFSGTPYLARPERIPVEEGLSVSSAEIANIVYYYPLLRGIGNFLKRPVVTVSNAAQSNLIVADGVRAFFDQYRDTVYPGGLTAKLGIYCSSIEKLENTVYPLVAQILDEYGIPKSAILKFHRGNARYPQGADSQLAFNSLDQPISQIRVVLLVQIGKEGWDCRSLTGIILSQAGDCPKNMVLQTACRCLRQVEKHVPETALIYLNASNASTFTAQLRQQQHISLREFQNPLPPLQTIRFYSRMEHLRLPELAFYQMDIRYETHDHAEPPDPAAAIAAATDGAERSYLVRSTDLEMRPISTERVSRGTGDTPAVFSAWLHKICRDGCNFLSVQDLEPYQSALRRDFEAITYERGSIRFFNVLWDRELVESSIRKGFYQKRYFSVKVEWAPQRVSLLNEEALKPELQSAQPQEYFPPQADVERIRQEDAGTLEIPEGLRQAAALLEQGGRSDMARELLAGYAPYPGADRSFHYLPYHMDGKLERDFFRNLLPLKSLQALGLEVYYNGERAMTQFHIRCYQERDGRWQYIGLYTPDFLVLRRRDGEIRQVLVIETKGAHLAASFQGRRRFMEELFVPRNNQLCGYERFAFLYLQAGGDTPIEDLIASADREICRFFRKDA